MRFATEAVAEATMTGRRMSSGPLPVRFGRTSKCDRAIRIGGMNFGDDCPTVDINGKTYRAVITVVETAPNVWAPERTSDVLRVPGQICGGVTDAAFRSARQWAVEQAPRLAEEHPGAFDAGYAEQAVGTAGRLREAAEASRRMAKWLDERAELTEWIAEGAAEVRPVPARQKIEWGPDPRKVSGVELLYVADHGRSEVVAEVHCTAPLDDLFSDSLLGYVVISDRRDTIVPVSGVRQVVGVDERWDR